MGFELGESSDKKNENTEFDYRRYYLKKGQIAFFRKPIVYDANAFSIFDNPGLESSFDYYFMKYLTGV